MKVYINFQRKTPVDVEASDRVLDLKKKFCDIKSIRPELQRLLFAGTELENGKTLSNYNIVEGSRIDFVPIYPTVVDDIELPNTVGDYVQFHTNCDEWMLESLVNAGSLMVEKDKWKKMSYDLTGLVVAIKKASVKTDEAVTKMMKEIDNLKVELREVKQENNTIKEEMIEIRKESKRLHEYKDNFDAKLVEINSKLQSQEQKMEHLIESNYSCILK